eukprot:1248982-Prymnesium_polylepis.2
MGLGGHFWTCTRASGGDAQGERERTPLAAANQAATAGLPPLCPQPSAPRPSPLRVTARCTLTRAPKRCPPNADPPRTRACTGRRRARPGRDRRGAFRLLHLGQRKSYTHAQIHRFSATTIFARLSQPIRKPNKKRSGMTDTMASNPEKIVSGVAPSAAGGCDEAPPGQGVSRAHQGAAGAHRVQSPSGDREAGKTCACVDVKPPSRIGHK